MQRLLLKLEQRVRTLFRRKHVEAELDEEIRFHLDMQTEANLRDGIASDEARMRALRAFGGPEPLKEQVRDTFGWRWCESLAQDLRFALRSLRKQPGFTLTAIATMGIGIAGVAAMVAVADSVLIRPLPLPDPHQVFWLQESRKGREGNSNPERLKDWQSARSFQSVAGYYSEMVVLVLDGVPQRVNTVRTVGPSLGTLQLRPVIGRSFSAAEEQGSGEPVALLSHRLWTDRFGGDPSVLGRTLKLGGATYAVIGVAPPGRHFLGEVDVWTPAPSQVREAPRASGFLGVVARLRQGTERAEAQAELETLATRLQRDHASTDADLNVSLIPLGERLVREARGSILLLLSVAVCVLLVICTNLAGLMIGRGWLRQREASIRVALGAGRGRLIRLFLTEAMVLSLLGCVAGLFGATTAIDVLKTLFASEVTGLADAAIDSRLVVACAAITLLCALAFGLAPAIHFANGAASTKLKQGGASTSGVRRSRVRSALVIAEIACSTVLVIGAGLLGISLLKATTVPPGFQSIGAWRGTLAFSWDTPKTKLDRIATDVLEKLATNGVETAGLVDRAPLMGGTQSARIVIRGVDLPPEVAALQAGLRSASDGYFKAAGIALLSGSIFRRDSDEAVVNQAFVRTYLKGGDPIGRWVASQPSGRWFRIIGVVADVRQAVSQKVASPEIYLPWGRQYWPLMTFVARGPAAQEALQSALRTVAPEDISGVVSPLESVAGEAYQTPRRRTYVVTGFAVLSLLIAAIGLYGLLSTEVAARTQEFGVRLALGAMPGELARQALGAGMQRVLTGLVLGIAAAFTGAHLLSAFLFGVEPRDATTFAAASLVLLAVAGVACWLPARRVAKVDPIAALRHE